MTSKEQCLLAISLQGKTVRFNHQIDTGPDHKVIGHDGDGMVEIDSYPGHFTPELFTVSEGQKR